MSFSVYVDKEGYIGDISAPTREAATAFMIDQGYSLGTFELREIHE